MKVQWYLDGEELSDESNIKIENTEGHSRLLLNKLQRKDGGEVKIKIRNEFGIKEIVTQLIVLGEFYSQENYSVIRGKVHIIGREKRSPFISSWV